MKLNTPLTFKGIAFVRRGVKFVPISLTVALFLLMMEACVQPATPIQEQTLPTAEFDAVEGEVDTEIPPEAIPPREASECPELDSQLFQLTQADDPPSLAEQLGFTVQDDKVQVLLILTSEDTGFLQDFGVEVGTQSGNEVQAFVSIDQLCELANTDTVIAIRPAAQAVP